LQALVPIPYLPFCNLLQPISSQDAANERLRLRAEIAADKERRKANKGVLPSVLGVDGYNPSIIQYDVPATGAAGAAVAAAAAEASTVPAKRASDSSPTPSSTPAAPAPAKVPPAKKPAVASSAGAAASTATPEQRVDSAIQTLLRYRTGGDGGQALKLLLTFVRNVAENPTELKYVTFASGDVNTGLVSLPPCFVFPSCASSAFSSSTSLKPHLFLHHYPGRYQSISTESNAFKSKLAPLVGPLILLKALGFQKGEGADEGKLKFEG
jgi:hypothetical protein